MLSFKERNNVSSIMEAYLCRFIRWRRSKAEVVVPTTCLARTHPRGCWGGGGGGEGEGKGCGSGRCVGEKRDGEVGGYA